MIRGKNAQCVMLPHSKAKVEFYQRYLEMYLIILGQARFTTEINIYDVYCGRGVYDDGALGSAIRSYETIQKNTFKVSYHEQKYPTLKFQLLCERQK